jgi:hypothetical protein
VKVERERGVLAFGHKREVVGDLRLVERRASGSSALVNYVSNTDIIR